MIWLRQETKEMGGVIDARAVYTCTFFGRGEETLGGLMSYCLTWGKMHVWCHPCEERLRAAVVLHMLCMLI